MPALEIAAGAAFMMPMAWTPTVRRGDTLRGATWGGQMNALSLPEIQDAIRAGTTDDLVVKLEQSEPWAAVAAALQMRAPMLTAHPELAFPILYDRLIWEHGPSGRGLCARPDESPPHPRLYELLQGWKREHGRAWLRSLLPPPLPLNPPGVRTVRVPDEPRLVVFSPDGAFLVWVGSLYRHVGAVAVRSGRSLGCVRTAFRGVAVRFHPDRSGVFAVIGAKQERCEYSLDAEQRLHLSPSAEEESDQDWIAGPSVSRQTGQSTAIVRERFQWRLGVGTEAQLSTWKADVERWQSRWNPVVTGGPSNTSVDCEHGRVAWRAGVRGSGKKERLVVVTWGDGPPQVASHTLDQQPDDGPMLSTNGRHAVFNGRNDFYHDCDYTSVVRLRDGKVVAHFGHRDPRWHEHSKVPPLPSPQEPVFDAKNVEDRIDVTDVETGDAVACLAGHQVCLEVRTQTRRGLVAVVTDRRRAVFAWASSEPQDD